MQKMTIVPGIELHTLVEVPDSVTGQVAPFFAVGMADDVGAVLAFAHRVDAATVEREYVSDEIPAAATGVAPMCPGASAFTFAQDKLPIRRRPIDARIGYPRWFAARNSEEIASAP